MRTNGNWGYGQDYSHSNYSLKFLRTLEHKNPNWAYKDKVNKIKDVALIAAAFVLGFMSIFALLSLDVLF